ncbi:hypothetical protein VOLCADRAFT_92147 [Volvox carteri f. nagariensis]|uniref:Hcy-binding domain-containing protein n=1 Tax=Volvox carteri f. nagariensis TaxID=3068 RepID=D8TYQ9_VOLCA|nr:uncharacterized protein VOLCADRAFT_92147 [Volvox carteri f. nagariensis]EFJ47356.1 hypothetical protein VOLCADRAFT_92147 [Volvox carteri f. nagariensis]|eukprot:XP_002951545.1 hypothetical protein VOLCADRAFT_92147 [Volvox carteri f. nagariensis]
MLSSLLTNTGGVLILDGAQGTELERRGVHLGGSKLWSAQLLIDDPDLIRTIHLDYLRAGSDVITTFTYQASIQGFADAGMDARMGATLLNRAVDLAESARTAFLDEQRQQHEQPPPHHQQRVRPLIAFSSGSYGAYLADGSEFRGDYADSMTLQQLANFHRDRLEPVRHRTEIDLLAFETVPCLREAEAILELLRQERYGKPAWISFSCRDAVHTSHGERFAEQCVPLLAAAAAEGLEVVATGVNCTAPRHLLLVCYPNSGEEWDGEHRCWRHLPDDIAEPECFAEAAAECVYGDPRVSLMGGCCRTGPEHIRALRRWLQAQQHCQQ